MANAFSGDAVKILCDTQRSDEWFAAKRSRISASDARYCLSRKGTKGRRLYVEKIADDLEGLPDFDDHDVKPWFVNGVYYESWARGWYSFQKDVDVIETGFVVHDDYDWIGCSPDGLVGEGGLVEIKYRSFLHTFEQHAQTGKLASVNPQLQTQMFVCNRQWCDYVNYWRSDDHELERGHIQRVHRDQAYIDNTLLPAFLTLWQDVRKEVERRKLQRARAMV